MKKWNIKNEGGIRVGVFQHDPDLRPDKWIVFLNGRTEFIEKYTHLLTDLSFPPSVGFLSLDHRGQGGSTGLKHHIDSYDTYADDLAHVIKAYIYEGEQYSFLTHSMGGLIGLYAYLTDRVTPTHLVLGAPLLLLPDAPLPRFFADPLAKVLTKIGLGKVRVAGSGNFDRTPFEDNILTHSKERYAQLLKSEYQSTSPTFGWGEATFRATEFVSKEENLSHVNIPILLITGSEEKVVDPQGFNDWYEKARKYSQESVERVQVEGAYHELFNESPEYYDKAVGAVREFLNLSQSGISSAQKV